ncbi:uncharacterized protein EV154DRAFT_556424, partial [Mucor mucedo]|uniref:uncharacterized protein n=1 Tax=Mucor mucedo TaxID=29922 RepID=UPI00221E9123
MGDIAEQERLERRRAKRQQKILASAASRLNLITGTQAAFRETPTPTPSTSSTLPIETKKNSLAEHYPTASDPRRQKYELSSVTPTPSLSSGKHRPAVQKVIEQEQAEALNEHGFLGGKIPQLLLASMLRKTNPTAVQCGHPANKYWNLLHFISMIWLGILAVYEEISYHGWKGVAQLIKDPTLKEHGAIHFPVFWYFVTLEIFLHFGRSLYQPEHNSIREESTFSSLATQLPEGIQPPVLFLQKYGVLTNELFRDLCIVIFVIG